MRKGIIYINSLHDNLKYVKEAQKSALSFKKFIPDAEYLLYTDATDFNNDVFDKVHTAKFIVPPKLENSVHLNGQMVAKLQVLCNSPYDRTLYLGSDTYAFRPEAASMFNLLDRFDIVAAHAPYRINTAWGNNSIPEIPVCYPEFNCDLVLFRKSDQVVEFLKKWRDMYMDHTFSHPHDQGAFRYLAYFSGLRIATLPEEYNYRGNTVRTDTIVLQNRDLLPSYLAGQHSGLASHLVSRFKSLIRSITKVLMRR